MNSEQSMEHQNTVKEALNALYHHPDDAVRMQADRWLQNFQRTLDAWQVADNLLHDATSNLETLIFCSQTLRSKVQRDFEELPPGAFHKLRDSLNALLKKFHRGPPKVRTQHCSCCIGCTCSCRRLGRWWYSELAKQ
ncbi:transportin MOS14-like isoform X2 [Carica papaya]|uniref:transportin MOS14-like isoform X2 n=1 Tax=Carica papaya TaxID=3649 RepID=UPI000B8CAF5C|nr:transportin MOS14-like isoform X2 [Carica papaya]